MHAQPQTEDAMKTTPLLFSTIAIALLCTTPSHADPGFSMTSGTENRSTASDLFVKPDSRILPITARFETERFIYTGTASYLQLNGLRGVPGYDFRRARSTANDYGTPLADFIAKDVDTSITYKVPHALPGGWQLDVTGGLKLQNGELLNTPSILKSYSAQLAFTREFGNLTAETGVGYRLRGNPAGFNYRNSANAYVGAGYQFGAHTKLEMYLDLRQGASRGSANEAEMTAYFSHDLPAKNLTLQSYAFKGVSQGNRDLETGLMLKMRF
jgi:hypothetical protein